METELKNWIDGYLANHHTMPPSLAMRRKALELSYFKQTFKASKGWLQKFLRRNYSEPQNKPNGKNSIQAGTEIPEEIFFDRESTDQRKLTRGFLDQISPQLDSFEHFSLNAISEWKLSDEISDKH
jgi:hypothetical protein